MTSSRVPAGILSLVLFCLSPLPLSAQEIALRLYMLDFVFLNPGQTIADREAYNAQAAPIAARHGVIHFASLDPLNILQGPSDLVRLDLWHLPSLDALTAWGNDPDYNALRAQVLQVHDMQALTLYMAEEVMRPEITLGAAYHLDLLTFADEAWNRDIFITYIQAIDAVAERHGIFRTASVGGLAKFAGDGPTADWMHMYVLPGPDEYANMLQDPTYIDLGGLRDTIFVPNNRLSGAFLVVAAQ